MTPLALAKVRERATRWHSPGFGSPHEVYALTSTLDGVTVVASVGVQESLDADPRQCLWLVTPEAHRELDPGVGACAMPTFSESGWPLAAVVVDEAGHRRDVAVINQDSAVLLRVSLPGEVEQLAWQPGGGGLLALVAGVDADRAALEGSGSGLQAADGWIPQVVTHVPADVWRSTHRIDLASGRSETFSAPGINVWEMSPCGAGIVAIASDSPDESSWYRADLRLLEQGDSPRVLYSPPLCRKIAKPRANASGSRVALIQSKVSDRGLVVGELVIVDIREGDHARVVDTSAIDVSQAEWINDDTLVIFGLRGLDTVRATWNFEGGFSDEVVLAGTTSGLYNPEAHVCPDGAVVLAEESWNQPPSIVRLLPDGTRRQLGSFDNDGRRAQLDETGTIRSLRWSAPDGLEVEGLLCVPNGTVRGLVVVLHGGPVWAYRSRWGMVDVFIPHLVAEGYAVLHPNPRGSMGRGQGYIEAGFVDPGRAEQDDVIVGAIQVAHALEVAPNRIAVMGTSYGGFLSAWLITMTDIFSAAVVTSPVTNWISQHFTSNIAAFDEEYLSAAVDDGTGPYVTRSPVLHAKSVRTPVLVTGGMHDLCTPLGQSVEFFNAVRATGTPTTLVTYPAEGHGVRHWPAVLDYAARVIDWYDQHLA
jgi:dipeptidyl aminopeptidase/acylaminoacyl peptidase